MKILLTGQPGVNKTALLQQCVGLLPDAFWAVSQELHDTNGKQVGFVGTNADGAQKQFAFPADGPSPTTIGAYHVDVATVDEVFTGPLERHAGQPIILDEIGRMQIMSPAFAKTAVGLLARETPLLATITYGDEWTRVFTGRDDAILLTLTLQNRDVVSAVIRTILVSSSKVDSLSSRQQAELIRLARGYGFEGDFERLEKLFAEAVPLAVAQKIHETGEGSYTVVDMHSSHEVDLGRTPMCDCGLAQTCPHVQAVWLYRLENES